MKDQICFLLTGIVVAGIAWALWHLFGAGLWQVITIIALLALVTDNMRLRRALRDAKIGKDR